MIFNKLDHLKMDITDEEGPAWITFVIADCPSLKVLEIKPAAFAFFRSLVALIHSNERKGIAALAGYQLIKEGSRILPTLMWQ